jgi:hypothetical protein
MPYLMRTTWIGDYTRVPVRQLSGKPVFYCPRITWVPLTIDPQQIMS